MIPISYIEKAGQCVVCKKELDINDDVVVCPECGAPHHRDCWAAEGHCHYREAHGTDLEWHPREAPQEQVPPPEEPPAATAKNAHAVFVVNGVTMAKCPHCGKTVSCEPQEFSCPHCGQPINGVPNLFSGTAPLHGQPVDSGEPIDGIEAGKFARVVLQKAEYYLPRFRRLKKQGGSVVSWNWAAFLLAPYWLAFRKCYLWSVFAAFFDLLWFVLMTPMSLQIASMSGNPTSYMQILEQFVNNPPSQAALLLGQLAVMVLAIRAILFGLFGNYIYKKECMKRINRLDAMPKTEAAQMAFRLGGVNFFTPLLVYYATSIVQNLILVFLS